MAELNMDKLQEKMDEVKKEMDELQMDELNMDEFKMEQLKKKLDLLKMSELKKQIDELKKQMNGLKKKMDELKPQNVLFRIIRISPDKFEPTTFTTMKPEIESSFKIIKSEIKSKFINFARTELINITKSNALAFRRRQNKEKIEYYIGKCKPKMKMESIKAMKATWYQGINDHHNIPPNSPLSEEHILSLIVYSHDSTFCTAFRETYRKTHDKESDTDQISRHEEYAWFGRRIYESFVFYGSINAAIKTLYHGISTPLLFTTFYCTFNTPTSTTTAQSVATGFGQNGIIVKMVSCESMQYIKTIDMSLFTCFYHEEEHLIFETRLRIKDIFITSKKQWIGPLMKQLSLYDCLVHGIKIRDKSFLKMKTQKRLHNILESVMNETVDQYTDSVYANSQIKALIENNRKYWLNSKQINSLQNNDLKSCFVAENNIEPGKFVLFIMQKYKAIICPIYTTQWIMNSHTFDLISRVSQRKSDNVNINVVGPTIECKLSKNASVTFQPELTKVGDVFHVKMKFVSTHNELPIKVHFDVDCEQNKYFVSVHPQLMDTLWNNTINIELPVMPGILQSESSKVLCCAKPQETEEQLKRMSINMLIMIHNIEEFTDFHKQHQNIQNTLIPANMISAAQSYRFLDVLSHVYGISNSVISIFDSVSDLYFIYLLSEYRQNML
eukprot:113269_1